MNRSIGAGITASLLAITLNLLIPLPFVPSFIAAILVIYVFGLASVNEGLLVAFMTYVFSDGVTGAIILTDLYLRGQPYTFDIDPYILTVQIIYPFTAVIAGYVGAKLVQKFKPATKETQPPSSFPPPQEPIPPV